MLFSGLMGRKSPRRRAPTQRRAHQTVQVVLDAVARVLKRRGALGLTTNRIAEAAGVSIGSLYQYFGDKREILRALRDRHLTEMGQLIERRLVEPRSMPSCGVSSRP